MLDDKGGTMQETHIVRLPITTRHTRWTQKIALSIEHSQRALPIGSLGCEMLLAGAVCQILSVSRHI